MKIILPLIIICGLLLSFAFPNAEKEIYKAIDRKTYNRYKPKDTLYQTPEFLATECEDTVKYFYKAFVTLIKRSNGKCFLLDRDANFENDSTIIYYGMVLKSDTENGPNQKNGIWFHALFGKTRMKDGEGTINFDVDAAPADTGDFKRPTAQGIYFYEKEKLIRISEEQSEERFTAYKKDGFYFIPGNGRFFKRYNIATIK